MLYRVLKQRKDPKHNTFRNPLLFCGELMSTRRKMGGTKPSPEPGSLEAIASWHRTTHRWSTTNLSYRFPIFETSATALCGTTGISYLVYSYDSQDDGIGAVVFQTALLDPPLQEQRNNWKTHNPVFPNSLESSVACLKSKLELPSGNVLDGRVAASIEQLDNPGAKPWEPVECHGPCKELIS